MDNVKEKSRIWKSSSTVCARQLAKSRNSSSSFKAEHLSMDTRSLVFLEDSSSSMLSSATRTKLQQSPSARPRSRGCHTSSSITSPAVFSPRLHSALESTRSRLVFSQSVSSRAQSALPSGSRSVQSFASGLKRSKLPSRMQSRKTLSANHDRHSCLSRTLCYSDSPDASLLSCVASSRLGGDGTLADMVTTSSTAMLLPNRFNKIDMNCDIRKVALLHLKRSFNSRSSIMSRASSSLMVPQKSKRTTEELRKKFQDVMKVVLLIVKIASWIKQDSVDKAELPQTLRELHHHSKDYVFSTEALVFNKSDFSSSSTVRIPSWARILMEMEPQHSPVDHHPFQAGDDSGSNLPKPIPPYTSPLSMCEEPGNSSSLNPLWGGRSTGSISRYEESTTTAEYDPVTMYGTQSVFERQSNVFAQTSVVAASLSTSEEALVSSITDQPSLLLAEDPLTHKNAVNGAYFQSCDDFFVDPTYAPFMYTKATPLSTLMDTSLLHPSSLYSDTNCVTENGFDSSDSDEEPVVNGGYDFIFVNQREIENDDLVCPICKLVSRDPLQSECCGKVFCKVCVKKLKNSHREPSCPNCREERVLLFSDKRSSRSIANLRVYCKRKRKGCNWQGTVKEAEAHPENCSYQCIPCLNGCGKMLRRLHMDGHIKSVCPCRLSQCPDCKEHGQWTFITGEHKDKCLAKMVECENEGCGSRFSRSGLEDHQLNCPKQVVDCSYKDLGCTTTCRREDMEKHENQQVNNHLESSAKLARAFVTPPKDHLLQVAPIVVRLPNFIQSKELRSHPFLTAIRGYKMSLLVSRGEGASNEVVFQFCLMPGLYDATQTWPFSGKITLHLLNQKEDRNHHEMSAGLSGDTAVPRVVSRSGEEYGQSALIGSFKLSKPQEGFSANDWQTSLEDIGYLVDNVMSVRVSYEPIRQKAQSVSAGRKKAKLSHRHH